MKTLDQILNEKSNDYSLLEKEYFHLTDTSLFLDPLALPANIPLAKSLSITIIIPAWNVRSSILACFASIEQSSFNLHNQDRLQVVVVDDGSIDGTWEVIKKSHFSFHLTAVRQTHHGRAHACNTGVSVAEGDIIVSCDADMVLGYYTIEHLVVRHQQLPNVLLIGFRSNMTERDPQADFHFIRQHGSPVDPGFVEDDRIVFPIHGWPSNMCLASDHLKRLGEGRSLWMPDDDAWYLPDLVFGALFSLRKDAYYSIGGYDERFYGWGCEDGYLGAKAIAAGLFIIPIYSASGLHIQHSPRTEYKDEDYLRNRAMYFQFIKTTKVSDCPNWLSFSKKRIIESFTYNHRKRSSYLSINKPTGQKPNFTNKEIDYLLAIGDYPRAFATLNNNLESENDKTQLFRLGRTLFGMNRYKEAINILKEAYSLNMSPESTIELSIALAADGQFRSAHKTLKEFLEAHPQAKALTYWYFSSAETRIRQGNKYLLQGFDQLALRCFEAALIINPSNREALSFREKCLLRTS